LKNSFEAILEQRKDEISPRMRNILFALYGDWLWLDDRIKAVSDEIEEISRTEENYVNVMTIPGIGPMISTAMVATIRTGEAFDRGRDYAAWVGLVPRQYSTGGRTVLGRISKWGGGRTQNACLPNMPLTSGSSMSGWGVFSCPFLGRMQLARTFSSHDVSARYADGPTAGYLTHMFDMRCRENGIEHRLTEGKHSWTNGQIERMNRRI
jgi:hypothetical protein